MINGTDQAILASLMLLVVDAVAFSSPLYAEDVTASSDGRETKKVTETKPPEPRLKLQGWIEGGITGNPDSSIDNHNFGQLFKDRANEPLLNQASIAPDPSNFGGGKTTYFEITFGVTFYPPVPKPLAGLLIRPEVRYDRTLTNSRPFDFATKRDQWTIGCDAIIEF